MESPPGKLKANRGIKILSPVQHQPVRSLRGARAGWCPLASAERALACLVRRVDHCNKKVSMPVPAPRRTPSKEDRDAIKLSRQWKRNKARRTREVRARRARHQAVPGDGRLVHYRAAGGGRS